MVGAVIVMRRKAPEIERPYRTFGYPIVPIIYLVIAGLFVIDLAILAPSTSGIGYLLVLRESRFTSFGANELIT